MTDQLTIPDIADLLREEIRGGTCSSVEELEERLYAFPGHDSEEIADALDGLTGNDGFDLYRASGIKNSMLQISISTPTT